MNKTILRNNEDLLKFMRGMRGENKIYPSNMDEARKWSKACNFELPKKYPCHVVFTSTTHEIDDVGFGFYTEEKMFYTYIEDYEKDLETILKNLKELQ